MKSKLLVLVLSMSAMSFVTANGTADAAVRPNAAIEVNVDQEVAVADSSEEVVKAKKAEEAIAASQDEKSCISCR